MERCKKGDGDSVKGRMTSREEERQIEREGERYIKRNRDN